MILVGVVLGCILMIKLDYTNVSNRIIQEEGLEIVQSFKYNAEKREYGGKRRIVRL